MIKKTVLIRGCSSGFGKLAAKTFYDSGWNVIGIGVWFWDYRWVEPVYTRSNESLRNRVLRILEEGKEDETSHE